MNDPDSVLAVGFSCITAGTILILIAYDNRKRKTVRNICLLIGIPTLIAGIFLGILAAYIWLT